MEPMENSFVLVSLKNSLAAESQENSHDIDFTESRVTIDSLESSDASISTETPLNIIEDYFQLNPQPPTTPGEYCGINEWEFLKSSSKDPTTDELLAALDLVTDIFNKRDIPHAVMGGLSLHLRGMDSVHARQNVDLAVPVSTLDADESAWLTIFKDELR